MFESDYVQLASFVNGMLLIMLCMVNMMNRCG